MLTVLSQGQSVQWWTKFMYVYVLSWYAIMIYAADRFSRGQWNDVGVLFCIHCDIYFNEAYFRILCQYFFMYSILNCCQTSKIIWTKFKNLNVPHLVLQLSLCNPLKVIQYVEN